jgi:hypothetical protein
MICWRVCDVVKGFARNSDDVLGNCKVVHFHGLGTVDKQDVDRIGQ